MSWVLLLGCLAAEVPPVLVEPLAACRAVEDTSGLRAAETHLICRNPRGALAALPAADQAGPRRLRLVLAAHRALRHTTAADEALMALAAEPGWRNHAAEVHRRPPPPDPYSTRLKLSLFALAAAVLLLGGARELLRLRHEVLVLIAAGAASVLALEAVAPALSGAVAVVCGATVALGHAAIATVVRARPGVRGRMLLATVLLLGVLGAAIAVLSGLPPATLDVFGASSTGTIG